MAAPVRFLSGRQQQQKIGIEGSTQDEKVLEVVGRVGIGTTIFEPSKQLDVRGDVIVSGELTVGDTTFGTDVSTRNLSASGIATLGTVEVSSGIITAVSGVVTYFGDGSQLTNLPSSGLNEIREEGSVVGTTIESINFVGNNITVSAAGTASTITSSDTPTFDTLDVTGHTELDDVNVSGAITATTFTGNLAGTVNTAAQPNITSVGTLTELEVTGITSSSAFADFDYLQAPFGSTVTFAVTVVSKDSSHRYNGTGSGFGYSINGVQAPFLTLTPGRTYRFTNDNTGSHPLKFYLEADKTTEYTSGVSFQNTYTEIAVSDETPIVLHYQCTAHNYMGNAIQVNSNVVNTNYTATLRGGLDVTGVSTFTSPLDINTDVDIDGHTELDNLNVSGVSTFVGLVTVTTGDVHIANRLFVGGLEVEGSGSENTFTGINTFTNLLDNTLGNPDTGALNVNGGFGVNKNVSFGSTLFVQNAIGIGTAAPIGKLDVNGHTELDDVNVSGVSTFTGAIDANGSLDVDGHTELDEVNVSGVTTFNSNVNFGNGSTLGPSVFNVNTPATVDSLTVEAGLTVNSNVDADFNGGLNVAGVSTFQSHVHLGDSDELRLGAGDDLKIYHNSNNSFVSNVGTGNLNISGDDVIIASSAFENKAKFITDGAVELYYDNSKKFETTGIGVSIINGTSDTATITGPSNLIIDPAAVGDNTGSVRIKGDLFVDGTQTQINSTTIELADFIVGIASTATTDTLADGAGIQIGPDNTFLYEYNGGTNPSLKSSENLNVASGKGYQIDQTEVLSATTLGSSVVNSSLTSVGTLGSLTVSGNITANGNIVGDNSTNITGIDGVTATTLTGTPANTNSNSAFSVTANGSSAYRFTGPGNSGSDDNPDLYLVRGQRYTFTNNSGGSHPFQIRESSGGSAYNDGVTNNGASSGNIVFNVQYDAPARLYYQCTNHGGMVGTIYIVGGQQIISGIVTATAFSGSGASLTALNASNLASGTIPDARFPATLPAISGANLTNLPAATTIPVADESSDTTCFPVFTTAATGSLALKSGSNLTFNSANGTLSATAFSGDGSALTNLSGVLDSVVSDTSPQLGGNLDLNSNLINGTGGINITGIITATTFSGSGASLDTLNASNLASGTIPDGRFPATLPAASGANLTAVDAATLDGVDSTSFLRSDAADVKTSGHLTFNDNVYAKFGSSGDLLIFHNGNSFVSNSSTGGTLNLQSYSDSDVVIRADNGSGGFGLADYVRADGSTGEAILYHYGTEKLATKSGGVDVTGDLTLTDTDAGSAAGPELKLFRNSASPADADYLGQIKFAGESDTGVERNYAKITGKISDASNGTEDGILEFAHIKAGSQNISGRWTSTELQLLNGTHLSLEEDDQELRLGASNDLQLWHNGSHSFISNITGNLNIRTTSSGGDINLTSDDNVTIKVQGGSETAATFTQNGSVDLYYDNSKKFETTSTGINVTGLTDTDTLNVSGGSTFNDTVHLPANVQLRFDSNNTIDSLRIYDDGNDSRFISDHSIFFGTDSTWAVLNESQNSYRIRVNPSGNVVLYHSGNEKFKTTADGAIVTGILTATSFSGDGSALTNLPAGATPDKIEEGNTSAEVVDTGSDGHFKVTTEGTERLRITSDGDVGIGSIQPKAKLDVVGNTFVTGITTISGKLRVKGADLFVQDNLTGVEQISHRSFYNNSYYSNDAAKFVHKGGHPQVAVFGNYSNVASNTAMGAEISIVRSYSGTTGVDGAVSTAGAQVGGIKFGASISNQMVQAGFFGAFLSESGTFSDTSKPTDFRFYTNPNGAIVPTEKVRITSEGNVGIGSTIPTSKLDVVGDARVTGITTLQGNIFVPDNTYLRFGDGNDLSIAHVSSVNTFSSNSIHGIKFLTKKLTIKNETDNETGIEFTQNGSVDLYYDGSKKLETVTGGVTVTGTLTATAFSGDGSALTGVSFDLVNDTTPQLGGDLNTNGNLIQFPDSGSSSANRVTFGDASDLSIYHDGNHSQIKDSGTGNLQLLTSSFKALASDGSETYISAVRDGAVELYYDNSKKLETTNAGVTVTGTVTADGLSLGDSEYAYFGAGNDLQVYHDGSNSFISDNGTGDLYIRGSNIVHLQSQAGEDGIKIVSNGAVELYHDNSKKLETTADGAIVTGILTATSFAGDGSALTGISAGGSPEFYTGITSSTQITPLSFETAVFTFPSTSGRQYVIESINVANVDESVGVGTTVNIIASIEDATAAEQTYIAYNVPIVTGGLIELLKNPIVAGPSDVIRMWTTNDDYVGVNNAADVYINYTEFESTDYISKFASSTTITSTDAVTLYTSTGNPTMIEKIGFANRTDTGDFPVSIKITNGVTTSYLAKNLIIPRYSTVDILDRHKRIETGAKIEVEVGSTNTVDVIISGKKITS